MTDRICDVIVIGAGTAGLKAYKAATARGADTVIVERGPGGSTSRLGLDALAHAKRREKRARESALSFSLDAEDDAGEARARRGGEGEGRGQRDGKQFRARRDETPSHPGGLNAHAKEAIDRRRRDGHHLCRAWRKAVQKATSSAH